MKTKTKSKTKAGLPTKRSAVRPAAQTAPLTEFEIETITVSLELATEHFGKAAGKWPQGNKLRDLHEAFASSAKRILDLIRDGQFSLDLGGAP